MKKIEEEQDNVFSLSPHFLCFFVFFPLPRPVIQLEVVNKAPRNSLKP